MLIQPSSSTQTSSEKLFSELNKNLRQLNASVCCQNAQSSEASDDYEYIPVYEYKQLYTSTFSTTPRSSNLIEISNGNVTFTASSDVSNMCDSWSVEQDIIYPITYYEDSLGRSFEMNGTTTVNYQSYIDKEIKVRLHVHRASGFKQIHELLINTNSGGNVVTAIVNRVYSNTNVSNIEDTVIMAGLIPTPYEIMVKDILEVRRNGAFVKYVDLSHNDYSPTYCLSYNPVMPFTSLDVPELKVNYDAVEYVEVTSSTLSILSDTVHTISILSSGGTTDISIDGGTAASLLDGQSITFPFSTLNKNAIDITPVSKAYVSLIKPR